MKLHGSIFSHSIFSVSRCQFPVPIPFSHVKIDVWLEVNFATLISQRCKKQSDYWVAYTCHSTIIKVDFLKLRVMFASPGNFEVSRFNCILFCLLFLNANIRMEARLLAAETQWQPLQPLHHQHLTHIHVLYMYKKICNA